jgi:hypothetical protein
MAAGVVHLALEQGSTYRRRITWCEPGITAGTVGPPRDLTECVAHMQIRTGLGGTVLVDLTEISGLALGGVAGTIDIYITDVQTTAITMRRAVYDLYVQFPTGDRIRLIEGKVSIDPAVTVTTT